MATAASITQVQKAYIAYYGRPADTAGLEFWATKLDTAGGNLNAIIDAFGNSAESTALYASTSTATKVNNIYKQTFGRDAEFAGLTYWVNQIDTGAVSAAAAALAILGGAQGADLTTVNNKVTVAASFTAAIDTTAELLGYVGDTAAATARTFLSTVTADPASVTSATANIASTLNTIVATGGATGSTFTLTTGVDQGAAFTGGAANDTFVATVDGTGTQTGTLNTSDVIAGGAGTDVLNLTVTATNTAALNAASISGIETINVRAAAAAVTATVDASTAVGATAVNANQGAGAVTVTGLATGAAIGVIGNGTVTNGAVTFNYATATDAITLNVAGGTKVGTNVSNGAGGNATTATINSTGAANTLGTVDLNATGANITSLTVNATTDFTATLAGDYANTAALTVTGAGKVNVGSAGTFKTIDASANSGGLTMTLDTVTTSFKGSTGNDTVTTDTLAAPAANIIDGGAGTDTLVVAAAANVATAALRGAYTGFEKLSNSAGVSIAADGFTGVTGLITSSAGGGFSGMTAAQAASVDVTADLGATATAYALATSTGTSDVLGLNIKSATATTELDATNLTVTGFETVNLAIGSGSKTLYNAAGTTQLVAGTDYSNIDFAAAADLKTVNLSGDYAAKVDVSTFAAVTAVNASANTAGADIVIGGQTGTVVVTGTASRDVITLGAAGAGGLQTVNAGAGDDSIVAAQAQIAVATINGGAGRDTLTVTDAGAVVVNDNNFAGVSAIEALNFSAATGLTFSVGGYANSLATANAGVLEITAAALTAATTIDGTGLSASNSLKLNLTNVDAAANATATTITLSQGADNITITQAGAASTDTITINGGVAALASTAAKTIDLSGVTVGGAVTVTTGAGADVIKAAAVAGTYTGGLGADTFTAGAAVDTFAMSTNGSVIGTSTDKISGFGIAATKDILTFGGNTTVLAADATAAVAGANVQTSAGGVVTFATADNTLALKIAAIQADAQLDAAGSVAVFEDSGNSYVYYAGAAIGNADDQLIELTGVTGIATITFGATTTFA